MTNSIPFNHLNRNTTNRLSPGDLAPNFSLESNMGTINLQDILSQSEKGIIFYAYPKALTPGCTTEACDFRDSYQFLMQAGYAVLGISPDPISSLKKFQITQTLPFPLLSDPSKEVMALYGCYGEKKNYGKVVHGVIRSTFIISKEGRILHALYNVKATGHVARIRKLLEIN